MPVTNTSQIVSFDADAAREAIVETCDGSIRTIVEYDSDEFATLYAADATLEGYGSEAAMREHFARIHSYVDLDFAEFELFTEELFPTATRVRHLITGLDSLTMIRFYRGREGLFVGVDPGTAVDPILEAVEEALDGSG